MIKFEFFYPQSPVSVVFAIIGGLGLFLFGLKILSDSLKNAAGKKLREVVSKTTSTPFKAILSGIVMTSVIQSSSGTSVIVISLVSAGLMGLPQAMGVLLGSTIGTTVTSFLVGINIESISPIFLFIGAGLVVLFKHKKVKLSGSIILSFGILFLGLNLMGSGFKFLTTTNAFISLCELTNKVPVLSILIGTFLTALIQSSSAFIAIIQKIYETGQMPLLTAMGAVVGANFGTTITAIIASIAGNREAKQTATSLFIFKLLGTILLGSLLRVFVLFMIPLDKLIGPHSKMTLALYHLFYNIINTFILAWFIKYIVKLVEKIIPVKKRITSLDKLISQFLETPSLALDAARVCILEMTEFVNEMYLVALKYRDERSASAKDEINSLEELVNRYDSQIHDYLIKINNSNISEKEILQKSIYIDIIRDLERIADHVTNLYEFFEDRFSENVKVNETLKENLDYFFKLISLQIKEAFLAFRVNEKKIAKNVIEREEEVDNLERKFRNAQISLINNQKIKNEDLHYVDILSNLERISDHCDNIAESVINPLYLTRS